MDPAIDPSDRPCPGCYRGHPATSNRVPGIGRSNTLKTWLSMWSLETSKCQGREHLQKFRLPALVVQSTGDMGVFPTDAKKIFEAIGSSDKTLEMIPGAHYFEDSVAHRTKAADLMSTWIAAHA
jgi:esterase/lipase